MKTITKKKTIPQKIIPEQILPEKEIDVTYYICETCGEEFEDWNEQCRHASQHLYRNKIEIQGNEFYYFETENNARKFCSHVYWCGPQYYKLVDGGDSHYSLNPIKEYYEQELLEVKETMKFLNQIKALIKENINE